MRTAIASEAGTANANNQALILDEILGIGIAATGLGRPAISFDPIAAVNGPGDFLTIPNHGLISGDSVVLSNNGDDERITPGLPADTFALFVHKLSDNTFTLHLAFADALTGANPVNLEPTADVDVQHTVTPALPRAVNELISEGRLGTPHGAVGAAAAAAVNVDFSSALAGIRLAPH